MEIMKKLELMKSEADRISNSIKKITKFEQVVPTFNWIKNYEKLFSAPNVANTLRYELTLVEL